MSPRVLIIVPTHDHASTLDLAVRSALAQSVGDLDVAIIGDGVGDDTRDVVGELVSTDARVRFIDAPKSPSRSELVRHQVISNSDADYLTYLGDDDLFLPDHVEVIIDLLGSADFAHPFPVFVEADETIVAVPCDLSDPRWVEMHLLPTFNAVSLTGAAHTSEFYRRLPHGWVEAPVGRWSDHFFWGQILTMPEVKVRTSDVATTVKAHAATRQHLSAADRRERLEPWVEFVSRPDARTTWNQMVDEAIRRSAAEHHLEVLHRRQQADRLESEITDLSRTNQRLAAETRDLGERFDAKHADLLRSNDRVAELERTVEQLRLRIGRADTELQVHESHRSVLRATIRELERQRDDRQAQLDAIGASRSWRLSRLIARAVHLPSVAARRLHVAALRRTGES